MHAQRTGRQAANRDLPESCALAEWTVILTNVPAEGLSLREALGLRRVRWQLEGLFRVWKSQFQIAEWRSKKPQRILTGLDAKRIGVVLVQWRVQLERWSLPDHSLWKAAEALRGLAPSLAVSLENAEAFAQVLKHILAGEAQYPPAFARRVCLPFA
jgi:hypothetical protein